MMKHRTSKRSRKALCALCVSLALGGACGGRAVTIEGGSDNGAGASGAAVAASGSGATAGRASGGTGNVARGGSSNPGGASAGGASTGGEGGCAHASCPLIPCTGAAVVYAPGACCPTCQANCLQQPCPDIACASGYQLQTQPGQCCPTCVPSTMTACATGEKNYASVKAALLSKYTYGCATDADCVTLAATNRCEPGGCAWVPVWKGAADSLNSNLANDAAMDCAACGVAPVLSCAPPPVATCVNEQCQFFMPDTR
jgi:hypothetical protein